jgi:hypothetical protein
MARILDDDIEEEKGKVKKDGLIYQQRNDTDYKAEYEKLDTKGKFQFFKDYYLQTILIVLAALLLGGYYIAKAVTKPQTVLYIAIIDDVFDEDKIEELEDAVGTYLGLDNKRELVEINTNFNSSNGTLNEQLQSYLYAGSCDVVISSEDAFEGLANAGYFLEPDTSDTVAIFKEQKEKDRFYYPIVDGEQIRGEKQMDDTEYNFGISIGSCAKYKALGGFNKTAIVGVANSSRRQEEAAAFLQFMLDDSLEYGDVNPDFAAAE